MSMSVGACVQILASASASASTSSSNCLIISANKPALSCLNNYKGRIYDGRRRLTAATHLLGTGNGNGSLAHYYCFNLNVNLNFNYKHKEENNSGAGNGGIRRTGNSSSVCCMSMSMSSRGIGFHNHINNINNTNYDGQRQLQQQVISNWNWNWNWNWSGRLIPSSPLQLQSKSKSKSKSISIYYHQSHMSESGGRFRRRRVLQCGGGSSPSPSPDPDPEGDLSLISNNSSSSSNGVSVGVGSDIEEDEAEAEADADAAASVERWDVVGLGQAMVDFSGVVDDDFLQGLGLLKGTRKLVNHEERGRVLRAMDGCTYKAAAGGSLSNTLVALARLGAPSTPPLPHPRPYVAMAGSVGSDPLGGFYRTKLRRAGVNFLSEPVKDGTTGTVIVLTTPDAQRTMLAYQGTSSTVDYDPALSSIISKTNILVVEGYLFELPDTIKTISRACKEAHSHGALVAVTASDVSCIERHYDDFWEIIGNYADVVFANSDEARALCNFSHKESPVAATRYLSHFVPLVSVTDGPRGSYIGVRGEAVYIPPSPCVPVDTCGAGDAYASGILYGILRGVADLKDMGTLAARVAAVVVGQQGTRLTVQDAVQLAESFAYHLQNSAI